MLLKANIAMSCGVQSVAWQSLRCLQGRANFWRAKLPLLRKRGLLTSQCSIPLSQSIRREMVKSMSPFRQLLGELAFLRSLVSQQIAFAKCEPPGGVSCVGLHQHHQLAAKLLHPIAQTLYGVHRCGVIKRCPAIAAAGSGGQIPGPLRESGAFPALDQIMQTRWRQHHPHQPAASLG